MDQGDQRGHKGVEIIMAKALVDMLIQPGKKERIERVLAQSMGSWRMGKAKAQQKMERWPRISEVRAQGKE